MAKHPIQKTTVADKVSNIEISPKSNKIAPVLVLLALVVYVGVLYWPSLQNGFTNWDDDVYVTANENLAWTPENRKILSTKQVAGNFHPLTMWSLSWDRGADVQKPLDPKPFHRTNLFWHLLNTVLVFFLALRLKANHWVAGIAALFFAIHPMHVESVAWVSGRKDVLFAAFFLAGLIAFTYYLEKGRVLVFLATFALFVLSCLAKPAAIVFPLAAWLIHWYLQKDSAVQLKKIGYLAPLLLVSAIFSFTTLKYQKDIGAVDEQFNFIQRSLFAAYSLVAYLIKLVFPTQLSAFHPAPLANASLSWQFYAAPFGVLAVLGLLWWSYSRNRLLFFALAFFFVNLVLVLGFIKVGSAVMAERYTYISYTALFLMIGTLVWEYSEKGGLGRLLAWAVLIALAAYWTMTTRQQIKVWRNSETLWTQIVSQYPTESTLSYRGYHRYLEKKWDKALEDFDKAYAINPKNPTTVHIRAICLEKMGKTDLALKAYEEFEKNFPPKGDVFLQHATLLNNLKRPAQAIPFFEQGLALNPQNIDGWVNLSTAYFNEKQTDKAENCCNKALELNPEFIVALNNRGALRLSSGRYDEAIQDFNKSISLNTNQPQMYLYRSMCYERLGKKAEAGEDKAAAERLKAQK